MSRHLLGRGVTASAYHGSGHSPKPSSSSTGYAPGTVFTSWTGDQDITDSNFTFENIHFTAAHPGYWFYGDNVIVRNCKFDVGVTFETAHNFLFENCHVITNGVSITSVLGGTVRGCDIEGGAGDLLHITADVVGIPQCTNITVQDCFIHGPKPTAIDHSDGLQVRGIDGLTLTHTVIDMGPWIPYDDEPLNAAFFLENSNGGNENITVDDCWFNGGGYCLRYFSVGGTFSITNTRVGPDFFYGVKDSNITPTQSGNITEADGLPVAL